ncbi:hypothetical protein HDU67_004616, partial [Dinochytrium kinnereticum]
MGASAIFYAHLSKVYLQYPTNPLLPTVYFTVLGSIVIHGLSVPLLHITLTTPSSRVPDPNQKKEE